LEEALQDTIIFAKAANRLHLDAAEKVVRKAIKHTRHSYFCLFDRLPKEVHSMYYGEDLAQEMLDNIN